MNDNNNNNNYNNTDRFHISDDVCGVNNMCTHQLYKARPKRTNPSQEYGSEPMSSALKQGGEPEKEEMQEEKEVVIFCHSCQFLYRFIYRQKTLVRIFFGGTPGIVQGSHYYSPR